MGKKYLFSPIGNTDPIKYLYDGSMLHICRYYEPDVVYLYLSKEMAEKDVYSRHLQLVIEKKCKDDLLKQRTEELVQIEYNVRNIAAHNIVSATPEWVKEQAGRSVEDILWLLKYICEQVKINTRKENWDSYDYMNKRIIEELDR